MTTRDDWSTFRKLLGVLAAANVARSVVVPNEIHLPFNLGVGAVAFGIGKQAGLTTAELGLDRSRWSAGLRWGAGAAALVGGALAVGAMASLSALVDDPRGDIALGELARRALVVIPLGTVLVEEIAFRGALLGLARRVMSPTRSVAVTAGLFGLWHVLPVLRSGSGSPWAEAALTLAGTTVAGLVFGWLRIRSDSLVAPVLAHTATNSGALVAAWLVQH